MSTYTTPSTPLPVCAFDIEYKALKAMSLLASKDQRRFSLRGVSVERDGGRKLLVATDGRRLGIMHFGVGDEDRFEGRSLIIPTDLIKRAPKPISGDNLQVSSDGQQITITNHDHSVTGNGIESKFPEWRQVMPKNGTHPPRRMAFKAEFMKAFFDIEKALGGGGIILEQATYKSKTPYEQTPFCIQIVGVPHFFGVLMPVRDDVTKNIVPDWLVDVIGKEKK